MMNEEKERVCRNLDDDSKEKPIICVKTEKISEKEIALNHMLKKGWVCVQNDVCATECWISYVLTFADKEAAASFKVR